MAGAATAAGAPAAGIVRNRWTQLVVGIFTMVMIANLQYGWTLFVDPINEKMNFGRPFIVGLLSTFILFETWLVPFEAYLVDRFGPRLLVALGGVLVGLAWWINSFATSQLIFTAAAVLGGIGGGIVYGTAVGSALKWFPDRRGLAAGLTAAGYGAGSAATVIPIANLIQSNGYQTAFAWFGIAQGLLVIVGAMLLRVPRKGEVPAAAAAPTVRQTTRDYTPLQTIKTPVFWLMYLMMTLIGVGGLMATGVLASVAKDLGVDKSNVNLGFAAIAVVPFALSLDRILNGVTRPFWGWVSDHIGRERTMTLAFGLEACAILVFLLTWDNPLLFAICSGLAFFGYGEIYSLFPATSADLFGRSFATTNYGLLYTSKGLASLLIPVGAVIQSVTNSWTPVFATAVVFDVIAATLALTLLRRLATAHLARAAMPEQAPAFVPAVAGGSE
jgi:OFA family oxalate/formate antiporter-like MFS transporter